MSRVHYLEGDYEQLVINETIDGLFSSYRIDRNSLPKGFFLYEIRWDDSLSSLAEISPSVVVNHAGSFITKSPLEFDANNSIRITYTNFHVSLCFNIFYKDKKKQSTQTDNNTLIINNITNKQQGIV